MKELRKETLEAISIILEIIDNCCYDSELEIFLELLVSIRKRNKRQVKELAEDYCDYYRVKGM